VYRAVAGENHQQLCGAWMLAVLIGVGVKVCPQLWRQDDSCLTSTLTSLTSLAVQCDTICRPLWESVLSKTLKTAGYQSVMNSTFPYPSISCIRIKTSWQIAMIKNRDKNEKWKVICSKVQYESLCNILMINNESLIWTVIVMTSTFVPFAGIR